MREFPQAQITTSPDIPMWHPRKLCKQIFPAWDHSLKYNYTLRRSNFPLWWPGTPKRSPGSRYIFRAYYILSHIHPLSMLASVWQWRARHIGRRYWSNTDFLAMALPSGHSNIVIFCHDTLIVSNIP